MVVVLLRNRWTFWNSGFLCMVLLQYVAFRCVFCTVANLAESLL